MDLQEIFQATQTFGLIPVLFTALVYYMLRQNSEESERFHQTLKEQREQIASLNEKYYGNMLTVLQDVHKAIQELVAEISDRKHITDTVSKDIATLRVDFDGFAESMRKNNKQLEEGITQAIGAAMRFQKPIISKRDDGDKAAH